MKGIDLIRKIGTIKFFMTRSIGYLGIFNFLMLIYLTMKESETPIFLIPFVLIGTLIAVIVFGFYEQKFKIIEQEIQMNTNNNPMLKEILRKLDILIGEK